MFQKQFFIFGASIAYGVGSTYGGWANLIKQSVNSKLYKDNGLGEKVEVYNFAKPGATIQFVKDSFEVFVNLYKRDVPAVAFVLVGLNDVKAVGNINGYQTDENAFETSYKTLLNSIKDRFETVYVIGFHNVDESKTLPKINPLDNSLSFFSNTRIQKFNEVLKNVCDSYENVNFISVSDIGTDCLYEDGLHPNDNGHELIFQKVEKYLII